MPARARLDDHARVVGRGGLDRRLELARRVDARDPHRRAQPRRLDPARVADRGRVGQRHARRAVERPVGHLRQAGAAHDVLEDDLVHAQRAGQHARADVGDVEQLEQPLHGAVLAEGPVQGREDRVGPEQPAAGAQRDLLALARPAAVARQLHPRDVVARRGQPLAHRGGRAQRDVVLGRSAAGQDGDPHGVVPVCRAGAGRRAALGVEVGVELADHDRHLRALLDLLAAGRALLDDHAVAVGRGDVAALLVDHEALRGQRRDRRRRVLAGHVGHRRPGWAPWPP